MKELAGTQEYAGTGLLTYYFIPKMDIEVARMAIDQ